MRFSIIIPAYNSEHYIVKGLESIVNQTFKDYELIVVCDSCIDNTQTIAEAFGARTEKVNFHNDGLTRSRGLDLATGEYVLFMDDDDWWMRDDVLELLNEKIINEHEPDVIAFSFFFKGIGEVKPRRRCDNEYWIALWSKCWKREKIGDTRLPNVYSISDSFFHADMMRKNLRIVEFDVCLYYYNYLRPGSISQEQGNTIEQTRNFV